MLYLLTYQDTNQLRSWLTLFCNSCFTPSFGFALPTLSLLLIFFIKSGSFKIQQCKLCRLIPSFIKGASISLPFWLHSNSGWTGDYYVVKLGPTDRMTYIRKCKCMGRAADICVKYSSWKRGRTLIWPHKNVGENC